ncbi:KAP family P-loop NTPase fold protein [Pedobacter roseus]|uniref:KAP NTPase domain-containing protein n=1 Tax=Pedobacter roseus TaxID=336820 RepID=A0A7G9QGY9_9SPHI|nr:P-loop NTPase fold protein [Pedobacter roseus]QNN42614.1 hypothetical protein H9L23_00400 [Pedobacter roseus]
MKKYLDDKAVDDAADDKFGHLNLAKQISEIIKEQTTDLPINIGLFGKWGVGKSTVIELLEKNVLAKDIANEDICFIRVNVWKYHSVTSIRNKIFYQIGKVLDVEEKVRSIYESSTTTSSKTNYKGFFETLFGNRFSKNKFENYAVTAILLVTFFIALFCLHKLIPQLGLVASQGISILVSVGLTKLVFDNFMKTFVHTTAVVSKPFESEEQFEHAVIDLFNAEKFVKMKKILFIDDLDRCSSDKVLMTLETIKTFLQINNCVFIVACDQDMVKKAVIDSNKDFKYSDKDGANYLEKFFQHFIYLPPYLPTNLRNYTKQLITDAGLSIGTDLSDKQLDAVIYILAYRDIINPRKIKVLLNSFIFDYYSIKEKESDINHPLQTGYITQFPERLAILTILKIDFPLFTNDLVVDPTLASKLAYNDSNIDSLKFQKRYFSDIQENEKDYHSQLLAYLFLVKDWVPRDFTPYLFVALETTGFNELSAADHSKYMRLVRDGNQHIFQEIERLEETDRNLACATIGSLLDSLTNIVERKNATIIFSEVAQRYPEVSKYIHSPQVLYAFRSNYESWFEKDEDFTRINSFGLINLIIYAYNHAHIEQGRALLNATTNFNKVEFSNLFFLLRFIGKDYFHTIESETLKDEIEPVLLSDIPESLTVENYRSIVPDFLGVTISGKEFARYCHPMMIKLAKIVGDEYLALKTETEKSADDLSFFVNFFNYLHNNDLDGQIVIFLGKLARRHEPLYKLFVTKFQELFKASKLIAEYLFTNEDILYEDEGDGVFLELILRICSARILSRKGEGAPEVNKSVYPVLDHANRFLDSYNSEPVNLAMMSCYRNIHLARGLQKPLKQEFIRDMILKNPLITRVETNLTMLLDLGAREYRAPEIKCAITQQFIEAVSSELDNVEKVEAFIKKYPGMIDTYDKRFTASQVSEMFKANKTEAAPLFGNLLKAMLSNLRKPLDLKYISEAIAEEKSPAHVTFCLGILTMEVNFTKPTNRHLAEVLPKIIGKTTLKPSDNVRYFDYPQIHRSRMLEVLLLHTDLTFDGDAYGYIQSKAIGLTHLKTNKARLKLLDALIMENSVRDRPLERLYTVFIMTCKLVRSTFGEGFSSLLDYFTAIVYKILQDKRSTLKSELQTLFIHFQAGFKAEEFRLEREEQLKLDEILATVLKVNPKLGNRANKLRQTFRMTKS